MHIYMLKNLLPRYLFKYEWYNHDANTAVKPSQFHPAMCQVMDTSTVWQRQDRFFTLFAKDDTPFKDSMGTFKHCTREIRTCLGYPSRGWENISHPFFRGEIDDTCRYISFDQSRLIRETPRITTTPAPSKYTAAPNMDMCPKQNAAPHQGKLCTAPSWLRFDIFNPSQPKLGDDAF